jgi:hypothetical protein
VSASQAGPQLVRLAHQPAGPSQPGTWRIRGPRSVWVCCPGCGQVGPVGGPTYVVRDHGRLHPTLIWCPTGGCTWHADVELAGWQE